MSRAVKLANQVQEMFRQADLEGRALTAEERSYAQSLLNEAKGLGPLEMSLNEIGRQLGAPGLGDLGGGAGNVTRLDPGARFVQSEAFKSITDPTQRPEKFSTGMIDLTDGPPNVSVWQTKGTLLEGAGAPGSGSGGGFISVPQVVPGVVTTLFQPLTIESLLSGNVTPTSTVRYVLEGTATSGAAGVPESGLKPESTLGLSTKDEPVKKIATVLPIAEELLEDAPAVQNFLNNRLTLFVQYETERQLFRGVSGGNEVQGILTSRNVPVFAGGTASTKAEQLFQAMNSMRGSALLEPEWVILHPTDWQTIRLLKDSTGQYLAGGPFIGAYGNPALVGPNSQLTAGINGMVDYLWGKPVYISAAIGGAGTALIGTAANACVWNRGGLRVEATNAHQDYFQRNLVSIRAERRLALAVYRSGGYLECRFAVGPGG